MRLEKEVQPASLRTGRTSFHSSRLTSLLSIAARTLPCKHTQSQLSRTGVSASVRRLFAPTQGCVLTVATPSDITFCRVKSWLSHINHFHPITFDFCASSRPARASRFLSTGRSPTKEDHGSPFCSRYLSVCLRCEYGHLVLQPSRLLLTGGSFVRWRLEPEDFVHPTSRRLHLGWNRVGRDFGFL